MSDEILKIKDISILSKNIFDLANAEVLLKKDELTHEELVKHFYSAFRYIGTRFIRNSLVHFNKENRDEILTDIFIEIKQMLLQDESEQ
ncbi:MAG: hypothetical protein E6R13_03940 [Spirochaetes bacterium]|nr:MAG: hypothetical protein E6R13_03940 [Spirochaetota bacterium]